MLFKRKQKGIKGISLDRDLPTWITRSCDLIAAYRPQTDDFYIYKCRYNNLSGVTSRAMFSVAKRESKTMLIVPEEYLEKGHV